ncbi:MAG: type II toxin-antitoxin system VapC family toxin [Streptosporangiaceae bacterium]|jgi:predicted nucleic acid-binding protein
MNSQPSKVSQQEALADTSIFVGLENARFDPDKIPPQSVVSVITLAELRLGVLSAKTLDVRAKRLATLRLAESLDPLPVDDAVADAWATLVAQLREAGKKAYKNDSWIAATAIAGRLPIATQDSDYDEMPGLQVIKI